MVATLFAAHLTSSVKIEETRRVIINKGQVVTALLSCLLWTSAALAEAAPSIPTSSQEKSERHAAASAITPPQVLSDQDIALYKEIFDAQKRGAWKSADKKIKKVSDPILMGYVKRQRYLHPKSGRTTYSQLRKWMAYYADHPSASEMYQFALKRRPRRASSPQRPVPRQWRVNSDDNLHPDLAADYKKTSRPRLRKIEGRTRYLVRRERATQALKEINRHLRNKTITTRQYDRMRSWIAASFYYQGYIAKAKELSTSVAKRHGESAVLGPWIAGLIAFREGDLTAAHQHFSQMAATEYQSDDLRAAAGFWSARTALAEGHVEDVEQGLETAAQFPLTFYGQLALAQLGRDYPFEWASPQLTKAGLDGLIEKAPAIRRAMALVEVGRTEEADVELRWINGLIDNDMETELLALAAVLDLPAAQIDIATNASPARAASLYPVPVYEPATGFKTDRAVLYALMRQESKFKVEATSRAGARGLMQLMPRTASYVAKDRSLRTRAGRKKLYDPALNLDIAQRYVDHLLATSADGDLFQLAVAYNGGPGNLRRWKRETAVNDALLFIESIPNPESRDYVEKVLTNIWIYRDRLGQATPSRDAVAAGEAPAYEALDQLLTNMNDE